MSEKLAKEFHESYERLASTFNYETRKASAVPWKDVPANNKSLMIAVCSEVAGAMQDEIEQLKVSQLELESAVVQPLKWTEPRKGHIYIPYDHVIAETPMGNFEITWKSWKSDPYYHIEHTAFEYIDSGTSLEEAKNMAQQYHTSMIASCLKSSEDE